MNRTFYSFTMQNIFAAFRLSTAKLSMKAIISSLIVFNFACHNPVKNEIIPISRHLVADTVCNYYFRSQGAVILKNGHIFMINPSYAADMYIYNIETGQMNYIQTASDYYFTMDDTQWFTDALLQHLPLSFFHSYMGSYYQFTSENDKVKLTRQVLNLKGITINKVEHIGESKYITLGYFRTGLLGIYDAESKRINYYGHYPVSVAIPFERSAMERIVQSFRGNIAYSDNHSKVVYGSMNFAYLSCYHFTGEKLKFQWEKHIVPPPATKITDGIPELDRIVTRGGFSDVAIAGDYIFAGYTQRNISDVAHSILVYNMTGNHVATFHTDYPISNIAIDMEDGSIYGVFRENEPVIVRFQFDKI